jgi:hypothetical protein
MVHELGFEYDEIWVTEFIRPFALWPHIEVINRNPSRAQFAILQGSPYNKYSPADIALLEDPVKRQLYIEAYTGCIAPRYRDMAAIVETKSALMENPPPSDLDGVFPDGVADWTKFSGGTVSYQMRDMEAFAHAWASLERRWEAGGAPAHSCTQSMCEAQIHGKVDPYELPRSARLS